MAKNNVNFKDFPLIIDYLKEFYDNFEDLSISIYELEEMVSNPNLNQKIQENFSKCLIQFLFSHNMTILKSKSATAIRHFFPPEISETSPPNKFDNFVKALKSTFKLIGIEIELKKIKKEISKESVEIKEKTSSKPYFYFKNYESVLKFLLYWQKEWLPFPDNKMSQFKEFLSNPNIYLYFETTFMNKFFGKNGLIKKQNLTAIKFFGDIFELSNYKRHSIYRWRDENYFPINVIIDIYKSKYSNEVDKNFYKYIKYIKIGRSQIVNKSLLDQIKINYEGKLDRFFPITDSMLGQILSTNLLIEEKKTNYLVEFEKYLNNIPNSFLDNYHKEIESIKAKLEISEQKISIKSLKLKNFKSYSDSIIKFQNGINILYGINGTGKTSILDGIFFALFLDDSWEKMRINNFFNLDLKFLNTHQIRVGEEECEVELELTKGEEEIKIKRKLQKDGNHQLFINNEDIFESVRLTVINKFKKQIEIDEKQDEFIVEIVEDKPRVYAIPHKYNFLNKGVINEAITDILLSDQHYFDLGWIEGSEIVRASLESVKKLEPKGDELNRFVFELEESISLYFNIIFEEIKLKYKNFRCLFSKNEIYSSLFQEFSYIGRNLYSSSSDLHNFILEKFGVNFIEEILIREEEQKLQNTKTKRVELISRVFDDEDILELDEIIPTIYNMYEPVYNWELKVIEDFADYFLNGDVVVESKYSEKFIKYTNESELIKNKLKFLRETRDFLFNLFSNKINEKLIDLSKEFFAKEQFYCFLDDKGVPKINFYNKKVILAISCLSGGERSKLILILLSLLIKISNKNSFFLIDEPNELLDPNNVISMKQLFSRLFQNRQIIISTFLKSYKSFRPALIFEISKDSSNISHIHQIFPKISEFSRTIVTLSLKEMNLVKEFAIEYGSTPGVKIKHIVEFFFNDVMRFEKLNENLKKISRNNEKKSFDKLLYEKSESFTRTTISLKHTDMGRIKDLADKLGMTPSECINSILNIFFIDKNYKNLLLEELIRKKKAESISSIGISQESFKKFLEKWKKANLGE